MTTQTLSRVTLETLDNYRTAATQAVVAYRSGGHRLVGVVNDTLEHSVYPRTAKVAPRATQRLSAVRGSVSEVVVKGIDQVAERTEKVIEMGSSAAATQVTKAAKFANGIDNELVANGLQAVARLTMPGAKVALALSSKVAEGATALAGAAGARPVRKAVRKVAAGAKSKAAPVARKAKAVATRTNKRAAKVVAAVQEPAAKVARATRAAKKAAEEAMAS